MMKARAQSGYSLAEALVVMAIVGMMAVITVPSFMTMLRGNRMRSSVSNFETAVRFARQRAVTKRNQTRISIDTVARPGRYTIWDFKTDSAGSTSWVVVQPRYHYLDQGVYFANDATTPVADLFDDSGSTTAATDNKPDIIFNVDGTVPTAAVWIDCDFTSVTFNRYKVSMFSAGTLTAKGSHS